MYIYIYMYIIYIYIYIYAAAWILTPKKNNRTNQCNKAKSHISQHNKKIYLIFALFYNNIKKSALNLKKKWNFAKITIYIVKPTECRWTKKFFYEKYIEAMPRSKTRKSTSLNIFISILMSLLFYNEITSGEVLPREDNGPGLWLTTHSFKCYTSHFKGNYSSKTACCCGTTLRRKGLTKMSHKQQ